MTDYLIRHITDSTNHTFTEVIKPRENERYEIVSAESKEEAEEMAKRPKGLLEVVPSSFNNNSVSIEATKGCMFVEENEKGE
ncbi:MAG: DUF1381 domain-containing protein [Staphylococcus equorum]|nr:DUF1381 domain-containing protein [Staphylococcus equorum]